MNLDYANQTTLHPLGVLAVVVLGLALLVVPRRHAVLPLILMACFVAPGQRIVVASLDFDLLRVLVLFGYLRLLLRGEYRGLPLKPMDYALIAWAASGTLAYTILYGSLGALLNRLGVAFDAVGLYFLLRCWVRDWGDLRRVILAFAYVTVPVAAAFLYESATRHNVFSIFGGVPAETMIRRGRLRCQGAFPHPIMAGCFFAALMPWFAALWWNRSDRATAVLGLLCAGLIVVLTSSSTPLMMVALGLLGGGMYLLRDRLRLIRWSVVGLLVALHMVMKKPVWHLLARINVIGGSTGWHRYHLVDQAIRRFPEWALFGTRTTEHWGWGLIDVTNQYVLEGVRGGVLTLALFVVTIALAFRGISRRLRLLRQPAHIALIWALGVSLLLHCAAFVAVSYFGQIKLLWYLTLAVIAGAAPLRQQAAAPWPQRSGSLAAGALAR